MGFIIDGRGVLEKITSKVNSKAVNTDWFSVNITPSRFPAVHRIYIALPSASKVKLLMDDGSNTNIEMRLNGDATLSAVTLYAFDVVIPEGYSYNIQHLTTTQSISCWIVEITGDN